MGMKQQRNCGSHDESKQDFSSVGTAFVNNSNNAASVFSLTAPLFGPQGESRFPMFGGSSNTFKSTNTNPFVQETTATTKSGWFPPKHCFKNAATPACGGFSTFPSNYASPQPTDPPKLFTFEPESERGPGKPLFSERYEKCMPNSQNCVKCGGKAPQRMQGPFDKHMAVSTTTTDFPSQLREGEYDGIKIMHPSGLLSCIPVMMVPMIPAFNGNYGTGHWNIGSGSIPGGFIMHPGTTFPMFGVPYNILATETATQMQPMPLAGAIPLSQMF